ncbi:MAG: hypothetical protein AAF490_32225 [Chloroflexota bacterium]
MSLLERYRLGHRVEVWNEIHEIGQNWQKSQYITDISDVVNETIDRVRFNVDTLIKNLQHESYEFTSPTFKDYHFNRSRSIPPSNIDELITFLENLYGPIPLIIVAWMRFVGDVNLVGNHPLWPEKDMFTDALVVEFEFGAWPLSKAEIQTQYEFELEQWHDLAEGFGAENAPKFKWHFSPDVYLKVAVSGGQAYGIFLPDDSVDASIEIHGNQMYFIDYLRHCFTWGGFPGFGDKEKGRDNGVIERLSEGLLQI